LDSKARRAVLYRLPPKAKKVFWLYTGHVWAGHKKINMVFNANDLFFSTKTKLCVVTIVYAYGIPLYRLHTYIKENLTQIYRQYIEVYKCS
jgi:hypothetical protein